MRKPNKKDWCCPLSLIYICLSALQTAVVSYKSKCPTKKEYWASQLTKEMGTTIRRNSKFVVYPKPREAITALCKYLREAEKLFRVNAGTRKERKKKFITFLQPLRLQSEDFSPSGHGVLWSPRASLGGCRGWKPFSDLQLWVRVVTAGSCRHCLQQGTCRAERCPLMAPNNELLSWLWQPAGVPEISSDWMEILDADDAYNIHQTIKSIDLLITEEKKSRGFRLGN